MKEYDFHFIGIGGIGMSAIAKHYISQGFYVSGSDLVENGETLHLKRLGAKVFVGHDARNVCAKAVVFTSAVSADNCELLYARNKGLKIMERKEALSQIFNSYGTRVAISGMHGKTTATAMLSHILNNLSPACFIGGVSENYGSNYIGGDGDVCITEACEYKANFLSLKPTIGIVLNVDLDHTDYYKNIEDIEDAFCEFLKPTLVGGFQVINAESEFLLKKYPDAITFGIDRGRFNAKNISCTDGKYQFTAYDEDKELVKVTLQLYGKHSIMNALCCIAVCSLLKVDYDTCAQAIRSFTGTKRRFTKHECSYTNLFEDYAHHPKEISSLIETVKSIPHDRIIIVFQPHTYTRTRDLLPLFAQAFKGADCLCLAEVYAAREPKLSGGTSKDLFREIVNIKSVPDVRLFNNITTLSEHIKSFAHKDDLVIVTGAGDIDKIIPLLTCSPD